MDWKKKFYILKHTTPINEKKYKISFSHRKKRESAVYETEELQTDPRS